MTNSYNWYVTPEEYKKAEENNISRARVDYRIRNSGWSKKDALSIPVRERHDREEWCKIAKENSIAKTTFHRRLNLGWDIEMAATTPVASTKKELVEVFNKRIETLKAENESLKERILNLEACNNRIE